MFVNFSRLLVKDEIKKGSFSITFGTASSFSGPFTDWAGNGKYIIGDTNGQNSYKINSPAGEYGILYQQSPDSSITKPQGLIFYQAGIAVIDLSGSVTGSTAPTEYSVPGSAGRAKMDSDGKHAMNLLTGAFSQEASANAWRNRIGNISFNNTVELNSTIYFCRANHNEFNYSSNQTYITGSKIRVKNVSTDAPVSYITTVGLYSTDNELLAVAKLSEPLKKDPSNEITLRVRLDY